MQLGGEVHADYTRNLHDTGEDGYQFRVEPGFGYFVLEGLELRVGLTSIVQVGTRYSGSTQTVGFQGGGRYHFRCTDNLFVYAGIAFGPAVAIPEVGPKATTLITSLPLGLLIGLNRHVAIDTGARVEYTTLTSTSEGSTLRVSVGYFGVEAFFR